MLSTTINHIVVLPKNVFHEGHSFFQRYAKVILNDYQWVFSTLSTVPHDILEPFLDNSEYAVSKMAGSSLSIHMIREDLLNDHHIDFENTFNIIWSTKKCFSSAKNAEGKFKIAPLHITNNNQNDAICILNMSPELLHSNIISFIRDRVSKIKGCKEVDYISSIVNTENKRSTQLLKFKPLGHNCARPLYMALKEYGLYADEIENVKPQIELEQYINGMVQLSNTIDGIRSELQVPPYLIKNDVIIYCPSICSFLYNANSKTWNDVNRKLDKHKREFLKNSMVRNRGFSNSSMTINELFNPYKDPILSFFLRERQSELHLFTNILSIVSVNQFAPALRFPNAVMLHHDILKDICLLIKRLDKKSSRQLNSKFNDYSKKIQSDTGEPLLQASLHNKEKVLAICDFPIEWVKRDGFPIMFTHEISRIPTTPGDLCSELALSGQRLIFPYEAFKKILVIRSFNESDKIKNHLNVHLDNFKKLGLYENIELTEVNVNSEQELISALNSFQGGVVIFDCHGNHGGEKEHGWLCIGNDNVDCWSLANRCRIPPIIVLSACSTHPIDGSHASVANGFLRCGALSVIGTYAPIDAAHAGQFVARLLHRIANFIPILIKKREVSWREVISGFFRMSYVTDVLSRMRDELCILTPQQYEDIHFKTNCIINSGTKNWEYCFVNEIAIELGKNEKEIFDIINDEFSFVETMLYSQLGRPENIIISDSMYK
ncbi:CHAT domain-containing protein [Aeromonas veronii]|uniref:CHAT domain-containing protein n=1 Tax=Aeromonas veronii TaxID=654 RepID=UPI003D200AD8